jgi:hypothetical protein
MAELHSSKRSRDVSEEQHDGGSQHVKTEPHEEQTVEHEDKGRPAKRSRKIGQALLPHWGPEEHRGALEYLERHTAPMKNESGCRVWDKQFQSVNYRKVHFPSGQLLAFAAHNPGVPLEQGVTVTSKCGDPMCLMPEHLSLALKSRRGPSSALSQAPLKAPDHARLPALYTRGISVHELEGYKKANNYAAVVAWLNSSRE